MNVARGDRKRKRDKERSRVKDSSLCHGFSRASWLKARCRRVKRLEGRLIEMKRPPVVKA